MTRRIRCRDDERWDVRAAGRPSPYRLDLVFSSVDRPAEMIRVEAEGKDLSAFSDSELCWLLEQARAG